MNRLLPPLRLRWKDLLVLAATLIVIAVMLMIVQPQRLLQSRYQPDPAFDALLRSVTTDFRKIIVLMDGAENLNEAVRARCVSAGRQIFWHKQQTIAQIQQKLSANATRQLIQYLTRSGSGLHDADKLAFLDIVEELD